MRLPPPVNCHGEWHTPTGLLQVLRYLPGGTIYLQHRDADGSVVIALDPLTALSVSGALRVLLRAGQGGAL